MAKVPDRIVGPQQVASGPTTVFTAPAGGTLVRWVRVSNPTGAPATFTLSVGVDGASTRVYDGVSVANGGVFFDYPYLELDEAEIIQVSSGTNNALVLTVGGDELAAVAQPAILLASKNLSSADLLDLHNTPVELLPAPGGRLYYVLQNLVFHYRFVTAAYNENVRSQFKLGYGSTLADIDSAGGQGSLLVPLNQSSASGALFQQTADAYILPPSITNEGNIFGYIWDAAAVENQPLSVGIIGSSLTGGDSTLTIRTFYSLIDGAP